MTNELLLLIKNNTDTLIEQTKSRLHETLENKLHRQMETFSFSPTINFAEEGNRSLAVTSFEVSNCVLIITE